MRIGLRADVRVQPENVVGVVLSLEPDEPVVFLIPVDRSHRGDIRVDGVVHVLRSLMAEADLIMGIDGYKTLADLTPDALRPVGS